MERTLVLVKPDGVQRGLIGEIVARFERKGLKVVGLRLLTVPREMAERHYAVHAGKFFYDGLVEFITSGPVAAVALEGPDAIATVRRLVGATMPNEANPGTIRGDLGISGLRNLIHASDAAETARDELALWFGEGELLDYEREVGCLDRGHRAAAPIADVGGGPAPAGLRIGLVQSGVDRLLHEADAIEREVAQPRAADDRGPFDGPEEARVLALRPVVAHHEVLALRHGPLTLALGVAGQGGRRVAVHDDHVGLVQPHGGCHPAA